MVLRILGFIVAALVYLIPIALALAIAILVIKALLKYLKSGDVRQEKKVIRKSLSEALRENRMRCKMTQEFVAETLGVSRQAVSKWENGNSDPSTSNLCELAKLYGVPVEELLNAASSSIEQLQKSSYFCQNSTIHLKHIIT